MGVRGASALVAALPSAAAGPAAALDDALSELLQLRLSPLSPEEVRALGELFERAQSRVAAGRLQVLAGMDDRDDIIPKARAGQGAATFAVHVVGAAPAQARRDARVAGLLRPQLGDLPRIGAAYAAGEILGGHVDVAVRTHAALGHIARQRLVPWSEIGPDTLGPVDRGAGAGPAQPAEVDPMVAALSDLADLAGEAAFTTGVRQVLVVDAVLARYARVLTVPEFNALAQRIVATLNPPSPSRAHEQRGLYLRQGLDGSWAGTFSCGQAQGARIAAALDAVSGPRPGVAIDADGVEHPIPDTRSKAARQVDGLDELLTAACARHGLTLPAAPDSGATDRAPAADDSAAASAGAEPASDPAADTADDTAAPCADTPASASADAEPDEPGPRWDQHEPPEREGEDQILRPPGVAAGPPPRVQMIVVVGVEHLAAAHALTRRGQLSFGDGETAETAALTERVAQWLRRYAMSSSERPAGQPMAAHHHDPDSPNRDVHTSHDCDHGHAGRAVLPPTAGTSTDRAAAPVAEPAGAPLRDKPTAVETAVRRGWTATAAPAHLDHAGLIDPETLTLLACTPLLRAVALAPDGAVLDLGRTQRLATATQKAALTARDRGCVIPGCPVPAHACDAHHVVPWTAGGPTDITNLVLTCPRHHTETHQGTWTITMIHGVPWVTPPRWIRPDEPLLRNAMHHAPQARREHR